jgi:hypothetical protein
MALEPDTITDEDDEPDRFRVRISKKRRWSKRRLPTNVQAVVVPVADHPDGWMYASFVSPDGKTWGAYAYWPKPERVPLDRLWWKSDGSVWESSSPPDDGDEHGPMSSAGPGYRPRL